MTNGMFFLAAGDGIDPLGHVMDRNIIGGDHPLFAATELAQELGMSKSWASRLHTRALGRLREQLSTAEGA